MVSVFESINVINCIYWFILVEISLHILDEVNLRFLMCSWIWFKCILLIFFGIHVHQEYWARLLCVSLSDIKCTAGFIERIWKHSFLVFFFKNNLRKIAFSSFLMVNPHKWADTPQYLVPCIFYLLKDLPKPTDRCQRESWTHGAFPKTSSIPVFAVFWPFKDTCFL